MNLTHCQADKAVSDARGTCYRSTASGTCSLPLSQHITKQICCCSRVGKAWGPACERCPLPDTDHFKEICPAGHGYTYSRSDIQISLRQVEEEELRRTDTSQRPLPPPHSHHPQQPQIPQYPQYPHPDTQSPIRTPSWPPEVDVVERTTPHSPINLKPESEDQETAPINVATQVTDIDRCSVTPTICGPGVCVPVQTGYTCYCHPGYQLNALQTTCVDINECESDPCEGKGHCVNSYGSYTCHCYTGYSQVITQNKRFCKDVNECDMPNKCPGSHCINTEGSYTCECHSGYTKNQRGQCEDIDECRNPNACPDERCVNTPGSFHCLDCGPGFRAASGRCLDVNECQTPGVCAHGMCVNMEGSYRCICNSGYQLSPDNISCQDVDECLLTGVCLQGRCVNLEGSYRCSCNLGYQASQDGKLCEDVDECAQGTMCPGGVCVNTEGSFSCTQCRSGYRLSQDKQRCEDVDECLTPSICSNGICLNAEGSYSCFACPTGYVVSADGELCEDIDECASPTTCPMGACTNTGGSFICATCRPGFRVVESGQCEDEDECAQPGVCPDGVCRNTAGSFSCVACGTGYQVSVDGTRCEDVDECLVSNVCPGRLCSNSVGSYSCSSCGTGYSPRQNGFGCEDIDECLSPGTCPSGVCTNTEGSYSCMICDAGYTLSADRHTCEDINECEDVSRCLRGKCTNTPGSYSCVYTLWLMMGLAVELRHSHIVEAFHAPLPLVKGKHSSLSVLAPRPAPHALPVAWQSEEAVVCIGAGMEKVGCQVCDRDECKEYGSSVCGTWRCENTLGSYRCFMGCQPGLYGQETGDCGQPHPSAQPQWPGNGGHREALAVTVGPVSSARLTKDLFCDLMEGSIPAKAPPSPGLGAQVNFSGRLCSRFMQYIDECENETICGDHGFCENTDGSYRCQCDRGYTNSADSPGCVDVNECEMSTALCGPALCENVEGSFLCICTNDNEEFDPLVNACVSRHGMLDFSDPIDSSKPASVQSDGEERKECYYNLNDANFCENVLSRNTTKQECCCTVGAGWGDNCEIHPCPINGRAEYNQLCPHGSGLLPLEGPSTGFGQRLFKDVDECEMFGPEVCKGGSCSNSYSTYSCFCRNGYYYDTIRLKCMDHDECLTENTCVDGICVNTEGSFNCFCSPPLILDQTRRRCIAVNTTEESQDLDEDIHVDICWQDLTDDNMCSRPLVSRRTTYTECCCLFGVAWGNQCAFCPMRSSDDYATLCNLPRRTSEHSDSLRERPGYEYGPDGPDGLDGPDGTLYWGGYGPVGGGSYYNNLGPEYGPQDPHTAPFFPGPEPSNDYGSRESVRIPIQRPREFQPRLVDPYSERYDGFEGLQAEECGILNGCENGRCVRVREGYTCDCFDGYELDLAKMACIDINECRDISENVPLCKNGVCTNTEGSYRCTCLPGFVASAKPHECIPEVQESAQREEGK
ncbi:hypothetical protein JZ751_002833 [Albula glossodonta]|uniref:Latent-transforming growth factor beta-binding protein 1 n=1 Tax=Albula glossodonta TaxID=121402 RepID=A0A8T2N979_9TELE|nr:hypothetical protein JZ751_002833 [Albula glossodonta]